MPNTFDRFLFTQIGLDSASLTMLGSVVHGFQEPGEYRGTVRAGGLPEAAFTVSVDKQCAVAQVNIDLDQLLNPDAKTGDTACCADGSGPRFVVHPKGFVVFHVGRGRGGYAVNVRRADENPELKAYDTKQLQPGDVFAAMLIRPGTYRISNVLNQAEGELTVSYPVIGKTAFKPPPPLHLECGEGFEPKALKLYPSQGLNVHVKVPAHLKIELLRADDGPGSGDPASPTGRAGWQKAVAAST